MIKKVKLASFIVAASFSLGLSSCSDLTSPERPKAVFVSDVIGSGSVTLDNESSAPIGLTNISGVSGTTMIDVDSVGPFTSQIDFTPLSVTVRGTPCPYPDTTIIPCTVGKIAVQWSNPNLILILDYNAQN
jgi:hypothetical protein